MGVGSEEIFHLPDHHGGAHVARRVGGVANDDIGRHIVLPNINHSVDGKYHEGETGLQISLSGVVVDTKLGGRRPISARERSGPAITTSTITRLTSRGGRFRA